MGWLPDECRVVYDGKKMRVQCDWKTGKKAAGEPSEADDEIYIGRKQRLIRAIRTVEKMDRVRRQIEDIIRKVEEREYDPLDADTAIGKALSSDAEVADAIGAGLAAAVGAGGGIAAIRLGIGIHAARATNRGRGGARGIFRSRPELGGHLASY